MAWADWPAWPFEQWRLQSAASFSKVPCKDGLTSSYCSCRCFYRRCKYGSVLGAADANEVFKTDLDVERVWKIVVPPVKHLSIPYLCFLLV
jgi:hypothetical protein